MVRRNVTVALALVVVLGLAPSSAEAQSVDDALTTQAPRLRWRTVARGLDQPVFLTAPTRSRRSFIVEQSGRILLRLDGRVRRRAFLDLSRRVSRGNEQGLLGLAFHPRYPRNGRFFVHFTGRGGATRVEEFRRRNPNRSRARPRRVIFRTRQPASNHNGGMLAFAPDGALWLGLGDGGGAGDTYRNGQNPATPLGTLLRFDINRRAPFVPRDNPWARGGRGNRYVWSYGLRNPWRFSFDPPTNRVYIGDVGQSAWEEIDRAPIGRSRINYGWPIMEGSHCYGVGRCDTRGLRRPALEYSHNQGCSVTGGFVYRGRLLPALRGHYFYTDFCGGWLRSFRFVRGAPRERRDWTSQVGTLNGFTSFGTDSAGELYATSLDGTLRKLVPRR